MRRFKILAFAVAFVVYVGQAHGQTPTPPAPTPTPALAITGQLTVPENTICTVQLTGGTASCAWLVIPPVPMMTCGQSMGFTGPPGSYTVICMGVYDSQPAILQTTATIQGTPTPAPGPSPSPSPGPTPGPAPQPTPVTGPLWAIAIFDTSSQQSLTAGQLGIWTSQTLSPSLKAMNVTFRRSDKANPVFAGAGWQKALGGAIYPWMVVLDKSGNALWAGSLPANEAAVISLITSLQQQKAPRSRIESTAIRRKAA